MPSADIFSLGISLYEVSLPLPPPPPTAPPTAWGQQHYNNALVNAGSLLPSEGQVWHSLRSGKAEPLSGRPPMLCQTIAACMEPRPEDRPRTEDLLAVPPIHAAGLEPDPTLSAARTRATPQGAPQQTQTHRIAMSSSASASGLFLDYPAECIELDGERNTFSAEALARSRVSTPTNFSSAGGMSFWQWGGAPPSSVSSDRSAMETSPMEEKSPYV
jgi:hypothetical protein